MFPTVAAAADPGSLCFPAVASAGLRFPAARDAEARVTLRGRAEEAAVGGGPTPPPPSGAPRSFPLAICYS